MLYIHRTYENTRTSTDAGLKYGIAHLTRNAIYDVHQAVERYNSLVNMDRVTRGDAEDFVRYAAHAWEVRQEPTDGGQSRLLAWSVTENEWRTVAPFAPRIKRLPKGNIS